MSRGERWYCWSLSFFLMLACTDADRTDAAPSKRRPRNAGEAGSGERPSPPEREQATPIVDAGSVQDAQARSQTAGAEARSMGGNEPGPPAASGGDMAANSPDATPQTTDDSGVAAPPPSCVEFIMPPDCAPAAASLPSDLRCTGLYGDFAARTVACGLVEYTPAYELWSDGAVKRRWVSLPAGTRVDTTEPDGFIYPVGTQFWKEFQVLVNGRLQRAETRLFRKLPAGWVFTTYVWTDDERAAKRADDGVADWAGSGHTVPTRDHCLECHAGRADRILGWDPLLLGEGARGFRLADLAEEDAGVSSAATIPGDASERDALGYLHVNCGVSCHNTTLEARARDTAVYLQLLTGRASTVLATPAVASTINKLSTGHAPVHELPEPAAGPYYDLLPGSPERSLLLARMQVRNHAAQMPPIASNRVDERGVALVSAWIEQMTAERGYPAPAE
jgi:hypothetical protein